MTLRLALLGAAAASALAIPAAAQTEIDFWHAFTGRLGELVAGAGRPFNESQDDYRSSRATRATIPRR